MRIFVVFSIWAAISQISICRKCRTNNAQRGVDTFVPSNNEIIDFEQPKSRRSAHQTVYLWPSLSERERTVLREAFAQISRRTCLTFDEQQYKPWYHADRWVDTKPYLLIRKSKKYAAYSDNQVEGITMRSILYITEKALNYPVFNQSRGMVMDQILRFMGFRSEHLRPDASSYIQPIRDLPDFPTPPFLNGQLQWPFDPESVSIPGEARKWYELTIYCEARRNSNIGAGQRAGLLTRWDAIKLNTLYCPNRVGNADPRFGPCVLPRHAGVIALNEITKALKAK